MKHGIQLLLALTLAVAPYGCNKGGSTNDSVSASSDNSAEHNGLESAKGEPANQRRQPAESAPTYKEPTNSTGRVNQQANKTAEADRSEPAVRTANTATMPAGTTMTVAMIDAVSTDANADGDTFTASLTSPLTVSGKVLAEKGAKVQGRVQNVEQPGKVKGKAQLELVLTKLTTGGKTYTIETEPFIAKAADSKERDAGIIAGGAGVGAIIGAVAGGKKGAAIGAIIGGGSGTTAVLMTKGEDLKIEPETRVNFVTKTDVRLPAR